MILIRLNFQKQNPFVSKLDVHAYLLDLFINAFIYHYMRRYFANMQSGTQDSIHWGMHVYNCLYSSAPPLTGIIRRVPRRSCLYSASGDGTNKLVRATSWQAAGNSPSHYSYAYASELLNEKAAKIISFSQEMKHLNKQVETR